MPTGPIGARSVCPNCSEPLRLRSVREQVCVACGEPVRISWSYRRQIFYEALLIVVLLAFATYHHASAGPWIIGLVLFWLLISVVLSVMTPARYG